MPESRALRRWLEQGWYGPRPHRLLLPLSWLHGLILRGRNAAYARGLLRILHVGVPTVIIGNVTVGGTGKTPLVIWLAQRLQREGRRPGVVLRGYGGTQRLAHRVTADDTAARVGDEAVLIASRTQCPVAVGARRPDAAALLVDAGCDIVIADDGLQHLALARDLEVLVIDGARGFGTRALLPAGPLRSAASPWLQERLVIVHGVDQHATVPGHVSPLHMRLEATALREIGTGRERPLSSLAGARVHAVAGIGNPRRFFDLLRSLGALPIEHALPDHHAFRPQDLPAPDGLPVVMTEKDAVKCRALAAGREDVFSLAVTAVLSDADATRLLDRVLALRRN